MVVVCCGQKCIGSGPTEAWRLRLALNPRPVTVAVLLSHACLVFACSQPEYADDAAIENNVLFYTPGATSVVSSTDASCFEAELPDRTRRNAAAGTSVVVVSFYYRGRCIVLLSVAAAAVVVLGCCCHGLCFVPTFSAACSVWAGI